MDGQNSKEKVEAGEGVECALNPQALSVFKEEWQGEEGVGSTVPDALITTPFSPHRVHLQEGNRCGRHSRSREEPTGRAADACQPTPRDDLRSYYGGCKV
jgi:hypothetical protein